MITNMLYLYVIVPIWYGAGTNMSVPIIVALQNIAMETISKRL